MGLKQSDCQNFGNTINTIYGSPFLWTCLSVFGNNMTIVSPSNFNNQVPMDHLYTGLKTNQFAVNTVSPRATALFLICARPEA